MLLGPADVQIWARPQARGPNGILVDNIISARFYIGKYGWGGGEIRARLNSGWLAAAAAFVGSGAGTDALDIKSMPSWTKWSFYLYVREFTETTLNAALWSGPALARIIRHDGDPSSAEIVFTLHDFVAHFLRKRSLYNAANYTTQSNNTAADSIAEDWITACYGKSGVGIITPPNYPVTRHNTTPWEALGASSSAAAPSVYMEFQPGQPLIRGMEALCERAGLYMTRSESKNANSGHVLHVGYPYQRSDKTASVILSPRLGTGNAFENEQSIAAATTVLRVRGDGAGSGQNYTWNSNSQGVTDYGIIDGEITVPARSVTATSSESVKFINRLGQGTEAVSMRVNETASCKFVTHWNWRDLVTYYDDVSGLNGELLVTGWQLSYDENNGWDLDVTLGDPLPTIEQQIAREIGYYGAGMGGGWTKQVDG